MSAEIYGQKSQGDLFVTKDKFHMKLRSVLDGKDHDTFIMHDGAFHLSLGFKFQPGLKVAAKDPEQMQKDIDFEQEREVTCTG